MCTALGLQPMRHRTARAQHAQTRLIGVAEDNYLTHKERTRLNVAKADCYSTKNEASCNTALTLQIQDAKSNQMLESFLNQCVGSDCQKLYDFIKKEISELGCQIPQKCDDKERLQSYSYRALERAQGIEKIYPEL